MLYVIVQLKCHQYWPEVGSINMGDLTIMLIEVQELAYYTIRTFRLTKVSKICHSDISPERGCGDGGEREGL